MISRRLPWLVGPTALCMAAIAAAQTQAPELAGTSPAERSAIEALCGSARGTLARQMCFTNQVVGLAHKARSPDLSVADPAQKSAIENACAGNDIPSERFECERTKLAAAGLPVRDEPGGGPLHTEIAAMASPLSPAGAARPGPVAQFPTFSLDDWRRTRPAMPQARNGAPLTPAALYEKLAPSVYIVIATDQPIELAERSAHAQGSAVAVSDHILLTNCHTLAGRPQIKIEQGGQSSRATLAYADPAGDRCFLRADDMQLHPVAGVRRFDDLHTGEQVFSVGTPVGLERLFGEGIISGTSLKEGVHMIMNSSLSWHGSSGGGLFDAKGNLIGITTAGSTTVPNLYFSIAAEDFWP